LNLRIFYFSAVAGYFLQVLIPKGKYKGQKLTKLVSMKIPDKANKTMAAVSEIIFAANKTSRTNATSTRIMRSIVPIFFFIILIFYKGGFFYLGIR